MGSTLCSTQFYYSGLYSMTVGYILFYYSRFYSVLLQWVLFPVLFCSTTLGSILGSILFYNYNLYSVVLQWHLLCALLQWVLLCFSDEGPYGKHSGGSRPPDGTLAIRRQSIPGNTQTNAYTLEMRGWAII